VTLLDSNGNTIAAATTDSTGNYILTSVPPGSYTLQVKGSDANNNHYMATMPLTVSNVVTGANLDALPSSS
jgi:protocatechuate 3,4-dioxygenase beta subunit